MRSALNRINQKFRQMRAGSVLILVIALLVLMAIIGTTFLSSSRVDRYTTVQNTDNTEIALLVEGVKNMAKATIVGALFDPSQTNTTFQPGNGTLAFTSPFHNWTIPELYHQFTDDPSIGTWSGDLWLSPRVPVAVQQIGSQTINYIPEWPSIGYPLVGNKFESPFVQDAANLGVNLGTTSLTYRDRMSSDFVPGNNTLDASQNVTPTNQYYGTSTQTLQPTGTQLTPSYTFIKNPDGSTTTYPAWKIITYANPLGPSPTAAGTFMYLAGDADGDGVADSGMYKLPVGQLDGLTYYACVRIIDNNSAVNVNSAVSRRYDFDATTAGVLTASRVFNSVATPYTFYVPFTLGSNLSNVGLAEMLHTYTAGGNTLFGAASLGSEMATWTAARLNGYTLPSGIATTAVPIANSSTFSYTYTGTGSMITDTPTGRPDAVYSGFGNFISSQLGSRPDHPGNLSANAGLTIGTVCIAASPGDAAALAYHFIFRNPSASPTPLESALFQSVDYNAPNGTSTLTTSYASRSSMSPSNPAGVGSLSSSYTGNVATGTLIAAQWYADNFNVEGSKLNGMGGYPPADSSTSTTSFGGGGSLSTDMPRRSLLTGISTTSNLIPQPENFTAQSGTFTSALGTAAVAMSPILPWSCKTSINTASVGDVWRAFYLAMSNDGGISPLGVETTSGHGLVTGQNLYTGSQWGGAVPQFNDSTTGATTQFPITAFTAEQAAPFYQHPQRMFRSSLRIPADNTGANAYVGGSHAIWLPSTEMVKLRSAIATVNTMAMRDAAAGSFGSSETLPCLDISLNVNGVGGASARVFGVTQQPYITEVYANTSTAMSQSTDPATNNKQNSVPYVAIEFYNPYPYNIDLTGWSLVALDRQPKGPNAAAAGTVADRNPVVVYTWTGSETNHSIPGAPNENTNPGMPAYQGGYALLDNFDGSQVAYRPYSSNLPATGTIPDRTAVAGAAPVLPMKVLSPTSPRIQLERFIGGNTVDPNNTLGKELVLMRPVVPSAAPAVAPTTAQIIQGAYAPVDSFDFTGLTIGSAATGADTWHYVRANQYDVTKTTPATLQDTANGLWRFVYPGRYDASDPTPYAASAASSASVPTGNTPPNYQNQSRSRRQQGVFAGHFNPYSTTGSPGSGIDPFDSIVPGLAVTLGATAGGTPPPNGSDNCFGATYPVTFPFVYLNTNQPGPTPTRKSTPPINSPTATAANSAPFGAFSRNSDILQVPFVGSYIISFAGGTVLLEANAITMDCSFAEDTDVNDDPYSTGIFNTPNSSATGANDIRYGGAYIPTESVGHFAPINMLASDNTVSVGTNHVSVADSDPSLGYSALSAVLGVDPYLPYEDPTTTANAITYFWRYHWASRVFDYLTVQSPNDDYTPNVDPTRYPGTTPVGAVNSYISPTPGTGALHVEDTVPVYGLINLNTAPWRVLAGLRFCPWDDADTVTVNSGGFTPQRNAQYVWDVNDPANPKFRKRIATDTTIQPDNVNLAKAIVDWRDRQGTNAQTQTFTATGGYQFDRVKGPFTSIADIMRVPAVQAYVDNLNFTTNGTGPDLNFGHLSPGGLDSLGNPITDGARNDAEERYDFLHRISNQACVRSDTFTVYICVQGWRNAGSTSTSSPPQLVTQRRAAFFVDRSSVNPTNTEPRVYPIPQD